MKFLGLIFLLINFYLVQSFSFTRNWYKHFIKEVNEAGGIFPVPASTIKTRWFKQPLDHFNKNEHRTWKMRYFERQDYWRKGGPIYVFINGEAPAHSTFLKTGLIYDLAKETCGAMYLFEHRYYGESKPFKNFTSQNLAYLSSRQALADDANLLRYILSKPKFKNSKVVVVGGSYAGNLAAWMKLLYPNLVDAAIASSAPVLAKVDFYEYIETVSDDIEQYGTDGCWDKIAAKFQRYEKLLKTNKGIKRLKKEENICNDTDLRIEENRQLFFLEYVSKYQDQAQYGSPETIKKLCSDDTFIFANDVDEPNLLWDDENQCASYDFDRMVEELRNDYEVLPWWYQTCTEFGYYQTTNSDYHPFTKNIPIELYYKYCSRMPEYDAERIEKAVEDTNEMYEGLNPDVNHVVFVNGDIDPWSKLGILDDLSCEAPSIVIPEASHCNDLYPDMESDSEELKKARRYIKYLVKDWISEDYKIKKHELFRN